MKPTDGRSPKADPKMSCVCDGNDAVLNGTKEFISNGGIVHLYIVFARSEREVPIDKGMTAFNIPRDLPGVEPPQFQNRPYIRQDRRDTGREC